MGQYSVGEKKVNRCRSTAGVPPVYLAAPNRLVPGPRLPRQLRRLQKLEKLIQLWRNDNFGTAIFTTAGGGLIV